MTVWVLVFVSGLRAFRPVRSSKNGQVHRKGVPLMHKLLQRQAVAPRATWGWDGVEVHQCLQSIQADGALCSFVVKV